MNYVSNVLRTADLLRDGAKDITKFEALQIAVQIQRNELFAKANVLNTPNNAPSALEKIAMEIESLSSTIAEGVEVTNHTVS
jgi:DNA primase large subunit